MDITRCAVVIIVLFLTVLCSFAVGGENWAVVAYIEGSDSMQNQVFKEMSDKSAAKATGMATDACMTYGENRKVDKNACKLISTCSQTGWFAIASMVKSSGHVGIGCGKETEEKAVDAAKGACGSGGCAKIFTRKITEPEKKKPRRNGG